jgi:NhaP-type Na+/H+ or K+/H+ antiporter
MLNLLLVSVLVTPALESGESISQQRRSEIAGSISNPFSSELLGELYFFSQIRSSDVGRSFICIIVAQLMRFVAVIISSHSKKYTIKERIFMGLSWIPKSTVPATLAGVVYTEASALGMQYKDYQTFGLQIQTTAILAIIVCEPIGSFLID